MQVFYDTIKEFISDNDIHTILDLGSRDAEQSIELSKIYPNAKVYAFECYPQSYELCISNSKQFQNISIIQKAVHNFDGKCEFYPIDTTLSANTGASSLLVSSGKYNNIEALPQTKIIVDAIRLDSWAQENNVSQIDIIWMDLQGAELLALQGLGNLLDKVKAIYTEVEYNEIYSKQALFPELNNFLQKKGFKLLWHDIQIPNWWGNAIYVNTNIINISKTRNETRNNLQKKIDTTYAFNHCYNIDNLHGTNPESIDRIQYFMHILKPLVKNKKVLDIGANKGIFSILSNLNNAINVISQEIDPQNIELLKQIYSYRKLSTTIKIVNEPVHTLFYEGDLAIILGVCHYLTYEHGLDWIYRLYIMGYDLLIEFPFWEEDAVVQTHIKDPQLVKQLNIINENYKLLKLESFLHKTEGLYNVTDMGRCPGLGRKLYYCQKMPITTYNINNINFNNYTNIYESPYTTLFLNKSNTGIIKMVRKYEHYPDRWIRAHNILKKEFPHIIPGIYYLVKDNSNNTKGISEEYVQNNQLTIHNQRKFNHKNLFKIQNFLLSINMSMQDIHPNHIEGDYIVDLEVIENLTPESEKVLRNRINEIWKYNNIADININRDSVSKFLNNINNNKNLIDTFKEAENYIW